MFVGYPPSATRWTFHPPTDPYGDGYVAVVDVELQDEGLAARKRVTLSWPSDVSVFFQQLADGWRGWDGERTWRSMDGGLRIAAEHDGIRQVRLTATLQADAWLARAMITVEAGEQMRALAAEIGAHFAHFAT